MSFSNIGIPPSSIAGYPSWSAKLLNVVEQALSEAWLHLIKNHFALISAGDEDVITNQLMIELVAMRGREQPPGFNSAIFGMPVRDAKLPDWNGNSIDQMPDLTIYPAVPRQGVADQRHDALFFECKVLDGRRGMDLYRSQGIERFTFGRYAWRMPHAGMLAYVLEKADCSPTKALTKYFSLPNSSGTTIGHELGASILPNLIARAQNAYVSETAESRHFRRAPLLNGVDSVITLRHLWLSVHPVFTS